MLNKEKNAADTIFDILSFSALLQTKTKMQYFD